MLSDRLSSSQLVIVVPPKLFTPMTFPPPIGATILLLAPILPSPPSPPHSFYHRSSLPIVLNYGVPIATMSPGPLPPLVVSILADFEGYLDRQRCDSPTFHTNSVGLNITSYSVPKGLVTHFSTVQPGHKDKIPRIHRNPSIP
jgi:hypothetical protein